MAWKWRYERTDGTVVGESEEFESRGDAESWVGVEFDALAADGVDAVTLLDGGTAAYGPMSLHLDEGTGTADDQ